jgi:hypothetical protein
MRSLLSLAIVGAVATHASAAIRDCSTLSNPIYLQVGDTQLNLMKQLGRALRNNTAKPITLVFTTSGSCTNIGGFYNQTPITTTMQYVPSSTEDPNWTSSSATLTCAPPTAGVVPDIGNSALFIASCANEPAVPSFVQFTNGPVQGYVVAVPKASSAIAITFEEAYFVFGFGPTILAQMMGSIDPWTDENELYIRTPTKSTLLTWVANVPGTVAAKWHGHPLDGSPMVVTGLQTSVNPTAAIGILGAEVYDANRATLSELAYRAEGQYAAYWADSNSTSRDKKNIRDGHYTVWSPTVWMNKIDPTTHMPVVPDTQYVIDMIAGKAVTPAANFDANAIVAHVGLVPDCAMRVTRAFDGGPLSLYKPAESCTCKFESIVDSTGCATCDASTPCATGTCRGGYCEEF